MTRDPLNNCTANSRNNYLHASWGVKLNGTVVHSSHNVTNGGNNNPQNNVIGLS